MRPEIYWIDAPSLNGRLAIMPRPRAGDWLDDEIAGWRARRHRSRRLALGAKRSARTRPGSEVRRVNKLIVEERSAASGLNPDHRARSLLTGTSAEVGLVERRLALDLGLEGSASVVLHERHNGKVSNVNSRRNIGFVHVVYSEDMKTVGALCKAIDAAYRESIPGVEAHIVDNNGADLHGNSKLKNLATTKL